MDPAALRLPAWVAPSAWEVRDELLVALHMRMGEPPSEFGSAVAATISWVIGDSTDSPITGTAPAPATAQAAVAEAGAPHSDQQPKLWVNGVRHTVLWLRGPVELRSGGRSAPEEPLPIPVRYSDGTIPTAAELLADMVLTSATARTAEDWRVTYGELRERVQRWRDFAALIEDTAQRLRSGRSTAA